MEGPKAINAGGFLSAACEYKEMWAALERDITEAPAVNCRQNNKTSLLTAIPCRNKNSTVLVDTIKRDYLVKNIKLILLASWDATEPGLVSEWVTDT